MRILSGALEIEAESVPSDTLSLRGALSRMRGKATTLEVEVDDAETDGVLERVLEAAAGTELERISLIVGPERYEVSLAPHGAPTHELTTDPGTSRLRLIASEVEPDGLQQIVWPIAEPAALPETICSPSCIIVLRRGGTDAGEPPLLEVLASLRRVLGDRAAEIIVQTAAEAPHAKAGPQAASARLPPEVIQRTIRQNFDELRKCYEQGLARDAGLRGLIKVRFVIDREGHVQNVSDGGSDLPDQAVRECVFEGFKRLRFPKPENGIVTVVYPIMLEPG